MQDERSKTKKNKKKENKGGKMSTNIAEEQKKNNIIWWWRWWWEVQYKRLAKEVFACTWDEWNLGGAGNKWRSQGKEEEEEKEDQDEILFPQNGVNMCRLKIGDGKRWNPPANTSHDPERDLLSNPWDICGDEEKKWKKKWVSILPVGEKSYLKDEGWEGGGVYVESWAGWLKLCRVSEAGGIK